MWLLLVFIRPASSLSESLIPRHVTSPSPRPFTSPASSHQHPPPGIPPLPSVCPSPPRLHPLPRVDVSFCSFLCLHVRPHPCLLPLSHSGEGKSGQLERRQRGNSRERRRPPSCDQVETEQQQSAAFVAARTKESNFFFDFQKRKKGKKGIKENERDFFSSLKSK